MYVNNTQDAVNMQQEATEQVTYWCIDNIFTGSCQYTIIQFRSHLEYLNLVEQKSSNWQAVPM